MDNKQWIGTRWRARCAMRLPKGPVGIGDEFVFDKACAELGLRPDVWLEVGNAEQIKAPKPLSESVAESKPDTKPAARPPRRSRRLASRDDVTSVTPEEDTDGDG